MAFSNDSEPEVEQQVFQANAIEQLEPTSLRKCHTCDGTNETLLFCVACASVFCADDEHAHARAHCTAEGHAHYATLQPAAAGAAGGDSPQVFTATGQLVEGSSPLVLAARVLSRLLGKRAAAPVSAATAAALETGGGLQDFADDLGSRMARMAAAAAAFDVVPLREYPGIEVHLGPPPTAEQLQEAVQGQCEQCGHNEVWVCLTCWRVLCSRYANKHAAEHAEEAEHDIALSLSDMSVWSFGLGCYLDTFNIHQLHPHFTAVYQEKFGSAPELPSSS